VRRLGLRLELDLRDNLERTLYATGTYEPALLRFLHDELRPGDVVLDVGAHIGVHARPPPPASATWPARPPGQGR
jgi:hypothetical protein